MVSQALGAAWSCYEPLDVGFDLHPGARFRGLRLAAAPAPRQLAGAEAPLSHTFGQVERARSGIRAAHVRPSFAYSLFVHSFHARRDRVVLLPPCSLYGAATLRPPPLGPGRGLTLPCGWNNAGTRRW